MSEDIILGTHMKPPLSINGFCDACDRLKFHILHARVEPPLDIWPFKQERFFLSIAIYELNGIPLPCAKHVEVGADREALKGVIELAEDGKLVAIKEGFDIRNLCEGHLTVRLFPHGKTPTAWNVVSGLFLDEGTLVSTSEPVPPSSKGRFRVESARPKSCP